MKTTLRILALSLAVLGMVAVLVSCKDGSTSDSGSSSPATGIFQGCLKSELFAVRVDSCIRSLHFARRCSPWRYCFVGKNFSACLSNGTLNSSSSKSSLVFLLSFKSHFLFCPNVAPAPESHRSFFSGTSANRLLQEV